MRFLPMLFLVGFSLSVGRSEPKPMVAINEHGSDSIRLGLGESVEDSFTIQQAETFDINVTGFHETLRKGFTNGYEGSFASVETQSDFDWTLELRQVELRFPTAAVAANGNAAALVAQIKYLAALVDKGGKTVRT